MDDYLTKPLDVGQLIETVERYLVASDRDHAEDPADGRVEDGDRPERSREVPSRGSETASESTAPPVELDDETMLRSAEAAPPFGTEELFDRCMGNEQSVNKLLGIFERKIVDCVEQLSDSVLGDDAARTAHVAHALKGAAANMAAHALKTLAARIELMGRNLDLANAGAGLVRIRAERDRCLAAIPEVRSAIGELRQKRQNEDTKVVK